MREPPCVVIIPLALTLHIRTVLLLVYWTTSKTPHFRRNLAHPSPSSITRDGPGRQPHAPLHTNMATTLQFSAALFGGRGYPPSSPPHTPSLFAGRVPLNLTANSLTLRMHFPCRYELMKARKKPFPEVAVRNMTWQVLQGLAYMHKHGEKHARVEDKDRHWQQRGRWQMTGDRTGDRGLVEDGR